MKRIASAAVLVRSVPYGETDLVVTFFTETDGKLSAIARGARRSSRRFGGALEPMHELVVGLDDRGKELATLREARIERPRTGIASDLDAMEAAGRALRWVRHACAPRTPEPVVFRALQAMLDELDARGLVASAARRDAATAAPPGTIAGRVVAFGLELLAEVGYALDLERCVRCETPCPVGRTAFVDVARGGLVCTACGGARRTLDGDLRTLAVRIARGDREALAALAPSQASALGDLVDDAMSVHAGFDPHRPG